VTRSDTALAIRRLATAGLLLVAALATSACHRPQPYQPSRTSLATGSALDPVANGITVLAYNTHLFKGSSAQVGVVFKNVWGDIARLFSSREGLLGLLTGEYYDKRNAPLVFNDDARADLIVARVTASGADIVGLQEVWSYRRQQWFAREFAPAYPYCYYPPHPRLDPRTTSGLLLLSKYRLTDVGFTAFPRRTNIADEEFWARKGVITATVEPWAGGPTFRVGITHACTDVGGEEQPNIHQLVSGTIAGHGGPAIMMGDLNVPHPSRQGEIEYSTMRGIFAKAGAIDAYLKVHGAVDESAFTVNKEQNLLWQLFTPDRRVKGTNTCLDYVFVKESGAGLTLRTEKAEVIRDWTYQLAVGGWRDTWSGKWSSRCVAVVSFQFNGRPHLFGLTKTGRACVFPLSEGGKGWETDTNMGAYEGKWPSNCVGTAVTPFHLRGHPYIFALRKPTLFRSGNLAFICRINDDGKGWAEVHEGKWSSRYVAVVSFQLNGHPYLFGLKKTGRASISRINNDGKGWEDVYTGDWLPNYVGTAITTFYLNGHPYIFALRKPTLFSRGDRAVICRINDDGKGWAEVHEGKWSSRYVAVVSFQLNGHPYLFGLKKTGRANISRVKDDAKGWEDTWEGGWSSHYVGTAITTFDLDGHPYMFALRGAPHNQGWITRLHEAHTIPMDLSDHYPVKARFGAEKP